MRFKNPDNTNLVVFYELGLWSEVSAMLMLFHLKQKCFYVQNPTHVRSWIDEQTTEYSLGSGWGSPALGPRPMSRTTAR